jgi:hypothetical protein
MQQAVRQLVAESSRLRESRADSLEQAFQRQYYSPDSYHLIWKKSRPPYTVATESIHANIRVMIKQNAIKIMHKFKKKAHSIQKIQHQNTGTAM